MKINICLMILFFIIANSLSSCNEKEEIFEDSEILKEWYLDKHTDADVNVILEKPDSLPQDIMLAFRKEKRVSGHIASFGIEGEYSISKEGKISISLIYPELPICCEWDEVFLDAITNVHSYESTGGSSLRIYYNGTENSMVFFTK